MKYLYLSLLLLADACIAKAQITQWAVGIGSGGNDDGHVCCVAPNGNVFFAGTFSGTIDLDPSASAYNVISNNASSDIFLACYTAAGSFLWGFNLGGPSSDAVEGITVDSNNNVIITGSFSGHNVDFDPSPTTTAYLSDHSQPGNTVTTGGDGFVAKYSATGIFNWAIDLGGKSLKDVAEGVASDELGNVYVGGDFHDTLDIDPSPAVHNLDAATGTVFLSKYTPAGKLVWGFNYGGGGYAFVDNTAWNMRVKNGYIYVVGCFQDTSDFDPSPATAKLVAAGLYDGYLAKYDTAGHYMFATAITGSGEDQSIDLSMDQYDNIYIAGYTFSPTITFNSATPLTLTCNGGGNNQDMFMAKYNSAGQLIWGKTIGGRQDDVGYGICVYDSTLYCAGYFHDTVDFDPSAASYPLISNGKEDAYVAKYDLDGDLKCAFRYGNTLSDNARRIVADAQGNIYLCGLFSEDINVEPELPPYILTNNGGEDGYLVKYNWTQTLAPASGYLLSDTICAGSQAHLTFIATQGNSPFNITYTNGAQTFAADSIVSGQAIVTPNTLSATQQITLVSVQGSGLCAPPGYPDTPVTVTVHPLPVVAISRDTSLCPGTTYTLHVSGGNSYSWFPATGLDSPQSTRPTVTLTATTTYYVAVTNGFGCADTATVTLTTIPDSFAVGPTKNICTGDSVQLWAQGGNSYQWTPSDSVSSSTMAMPVVSPRQNTVYTVIIHENVCNRTDTLQTSVHIWPLPKVHISEVHDIDCGMKAGLLMATGAKTYQWSPGASLNDPTAQAPIARPAAATTYTVIGTDSNGCTNADSATVAVFNNGNGRLFAPSAFTPNGDGKDDCFRILMPGNITAYKLVICNRWGQIVFASYESNACWDGTLNGVPQPMDTYYYYYTGTTSSCGNVAGKGDVTLVR